MIELPNKKKCYNLPEQVAQNLLNIQYLAEQYKNIDALPTIWKTYKEEFDSELETFGEWTTTFEGWTESLNTYLANMSSAAVGAIAGQNIAPANVTATGNITAASIIENMVGYDFIKTNSDVNFNIDYIYAGVVKNGNKLTIVCAMNITKLQAYGGAKQVGYFSCPESIRNALYPTNIGQYTGTLDLKMTIGIDSSTNKIDLPILLSKGTYGVMPYIQDTANMTINTEYYVRIEATFLLSDNLAA